MSRRLSLWLLVGILALGIGLRFYHVTARSLWFDEAFTWRLMQVPLSEVISRTAVDVHPPLYYLVLRAWSWVFNSSIFSLRSFSICASGLTIIFAYLFVGNSFGRRPALLTALFLALSAWQIPVAWEARMYTLGTALAFLSSWLLLKSLQATTLRWWLLYAASIIAFAYTHYFAFFTIFAQVIVVAGYILLKTRSRLGEILQWRLTWQAGLAGLLITLAYAPWLPTLLRQSRQVEANFWVPPPTAWSLPETLYRFFTHSVTYPSHIITLFPLVITLVLWLYLLWQKSSRLAAVLIVFSGVFPLGFAAFSTFFGRSLYQDRFLVFVQAFLLVALAITVSRMPWKVPRRLLTASLCLGFGGGFFNLWTRLDILHKPGVTGAANYIAEHATPEQSILVSSSFIFFPLDYYAQTEVKKHFEPKLLADPASLSHFAGAPIVLSGDTIDPKILQDTSLKSLWLIDTTGFRGQITKLTSPWKLQERQVFSEVYPHQGDITVSQWRR